MKGSKRDEERLKKACQELESVFLHQMIKAMRQTVSNAGFPGGGPGHDLFQSLFDMEMSRTLAQKEGIGLGKAMYENFMRGQPSKGGKVSEKEGEGKTDHRGQLDSKGEADGTLIPTRP